MTRRFSLMLTCWSLLAIIPIARAEGPVRVVVWDEQQPEQKAAYDNFLGNAIADYLAKQPGLAVKSARLDDPEQGLGDAILDECDVLIWWGHVRHREITPETAKKIVARIKAGKLSLIALHSAHWSAPFVEAMNERARIDVRKTFREETPANKVFIEEVAPRPFSAPRRADPLTPSSTSSPVAGGTLIRLTLPNCCFPAYRADGKPSHVRLLRPSHPICRGIPEKFDMPRTEMYDDPFHVPPADEVLFEESWDAGEYFRSGLIWEIGAGRVFYFRPGHETYPVYKQAEPLKVVENAARWLARSQEESRSR